jgi:hypothetical protein
MQCAKKKGSTARRAAFCKRGLKLLLAVLVAEALDATTHVVH